MCLCSVPAVEDVRGGAECNNLSSTVVLKLAVRVMLRLRAGGRESRREGGVRRGRGRAGPEEGLQGLKVTPPHDLNCSGHVWRLGGDLETPVLSLL